MFNGTSWSAPVEIDVQDAPANLGGAISCPTAGFLHGGCGPWQGDLLHERRVVVADGCFES